MSVNQHELQKPGFTDMDLIQASPFLRKMMGDGQWKELPRRPGRVRSFRASETISEFRKRIRRNAGDPEAALGMLRDLRIRILLDVARADLENRIKPGQVRSLLKNLGETLVYGAGVIAEKNLSRKFVHPLILERMNVRAPQAICSLSRLGGGDPFYTTLPAPVFVHSRAAEFSPALKEMDLIKARRSQKEWLPARDFFFRLVGRIMSYLQPPEVDRNDFNPMAEDYLASGPPILPGTLVIRFSAFEYYFLREQPLKQTLNLLRLRPLEGPTPFRLAIEELTRQVLRAAVIQMDDQLEPRLDAWFRARASAEGVKLMPGGLLDIERIIRLLQLRYSLSDQRLLVPSAINALSRLTEAGVINPEQRSILSRAYNWQWFLTNRLSLFGQRAELKPANLRSGSIDGLSCVEGASNKTLRLMDSAKKVIKDINELNE